MCQFYLLVGMLRRSVYSVLRIDRSNPEDPVFRCEHAQLSGLDVQEVSLPALLCYVLTRFPYEVVVKGRDSVQRQRGTSSFLPYLWTLVRAHFFSMLASVTFRGAALS